MAYFNNRPEDWERLDWQILRDGAISLYWRNEYLTDEVQWFRDHAYQIYKFECNRWLQEDDMFSAFESALKFPEWWGRNFDALNDCIKDLPLTEDKGAVLVMQHFDCYVNQCGAVRLPNGRTEAEVLLDIIARASSFHLLNGRRLVALIQSDDPNITINNLACVTPQWNRREWLRANRIPAG